MHIDVQTLFTYTGNATKALCNCAGGRVMQCAEKLESAMHKTIQVEYATSIACPGGHVQHLL